MNNDLISRSELLKAIETWGGCVEELHDYIEKMPTAYDINKVVEELDNYLTQLVGRNAKLYTTVIGVVKAGGNDDD